MNIGQAACASGVSAKMIRYYEQIGLIPRADRKTSGYRDYSDTDIHMLRFIRQVRDLGFSTPEIKELLGLWRDHSRQGSDVKRIALLHIEELRRRIAEIEDMADSLRMLADCCAGDNRPDCPVLADLEQLQAKPHRTMSPARIAMPSGRPSI